MTRKFRADRQIDRRVFLTGLASGAVTAIAGCSGSEEADEPGDNAGESNQTQPTSTVTPDAGTDEQGPVTFDHPMEVQVDEAFDMTISGLPPSTTVEVRQGERGQEGTATATVETGGNGQVDLASVTVVDGDVPTDLSVPLPVALIQFSDNLPTDSQTQAITYGVSADGTDLGSTTVSRQLPPAEPDQEIQRDEFVGGLFEPADGGQGPAVIVLHGSGGSPTYRQAGQLAQHGFTAFALDYFGGPGLPDELVEVPIEYVQNAAQWLLDQETTVGEQVGLVGASKGAELALLAGSEFDTVGSVVSVSGSGFVWGGISRSEFQPGSSWTLGGEPVDYIPNARRGWDDPLIEGYQNSYDQASESEIEKATILVENIDGPVLLISGGDDKLWDSEKYHSVAEERLRANDHPDFEHLVYEEAGHIIRPPYYSVQGSLEARGLGSFGGSLAGNAFASHDSWPKALETLSALE